jgi:hypothetical protein
MPLLPKRWHIVDYGRAAAVRGAPRLAVLTSTAQVRVSESGTGVQGQALRRAGEEASLCSAPAPLTAFDP